MNEEKYEGVNKFHLMSHFTSNPLKSLNLCTVSGSPRLCESLVFLALASMRQEGAFSPHRRKSTQLETRLSRMHSLNMLEIHSSSVQKSNMSNLYTNNGDMIVTAHMVTSLAWEIIQKSTNKHFKEGDGVGFFCCLPCVSFFKVKWLDLIRTDVLMSKKVDLLNSVLLRTSDILLFIIV